MSSYPAEVKTAAQVLKAATDTHRAAHDTYLNWRMGSEITRESAASAAETARLAVMDAKTELAFALMTAVHTIPQEIVNAILET